MIKKCIYIIVLIFIVFLLSGCHKYNVTNTINEDNSIDFLVISGIFNPITNDGYPGLREAIDAGEATGWSVQDDNMISLMNSHGWQTRTLELNDFDRVLEMKYHVDDLNRLCGAEKESYTTNLSDLQISDMNSLSNIIYCEEKENSTIYGAYFSYDFRVYYYDTNGETDELELCTVERDSLISQEEQGNYLPRELTYEVHLPNVKILSTNASRQENDSQDLFWDLDFYETNYLSYVFEIDKGNLVETDDKNVQILTEDIFIGNTIQFQVNSTKIVQNIIIKDTQGNIIPYTFIDGENGKYEFIMPRYNIQSIEVIYENRIINPKTFTNYTFVIVFILTISFFINAYHKKKNSLLKHY